MRWVHCIFAVLLIAGVASCTHPPLDNIPLVWKPTSDANAGAVNLTEIGETRIQFGTFRDTRKQPQLIAENREGAIPKPVTTRDDVAAFVAVHVRQTLDRAGLSTVDSDGDVVLSGEVRQFFVEETSTYQGNVLLYLTLRSRSGRALWNGTVAGSAKHFGRSYSAENYYQTLSDSTVDAAAALLRDADFRLALARSKSAR